MISTCPRCQRQVSVPPGLDSAGWVRCPLCSSEYALGEALAWTPPELIPVVSPVVEDAVIGVREAGPEIDLHADSPEHNEAAVAAGEFSRISAGVPRRRRKPKSALQTLIEVATGGVAGCLVAYYGLAFYYGPEFHNVGLPQIALPGISWITAPRGSEKGAEKPANKEKRHGKDKATAMRGIKQGCSAFAETKPVCERLDCGGRQLGGGFQKESQQAGSLR
jgi:hypothetical protein